MKNPTPNYKSRSAKQQFQILNHFNTDQFLSRRHAEDTLFIFGLPARIFELRQQGYIILTHRDPFGKAVYEMIAEPSNKEIVEPSEEEIFRLEKVLSIKAQMKWHREQVANLKQQLKFYTLPGDGKSSEVAS